MSGHSGALIGCARSPNHALQVELLGSHDELIASGSDDGHIFIWDRQTGRLVNLLGRGSDAASVTSLACHPHMPLLASSGAEPVVRLWSPEVRSVMGLPGRRGEGVQ